MKMKKIFLIMLSLAMLNTLGLNAQSLTLKIGLFHPAMKSDLWDINMENLAFDKQDMVDKYYGMEYEHFLGNNLSFSVEGGYYEKEHYSMYRDFEYDDGSPIYQNVALKITSMEVDFKFYPVSHRQKFYPFIGAGVGMYYWKYEQWGDFIDFEYDTVLEDEYLETSTYTPGFNAKAGFVFRFKRKFGVSFEARYTHLQGNLSSFFEGFEKLDLGGFTFNFGVNFFLR